MEVRTDQELRELAKGVTEGNVLFSSQVPADLLCSVFMPLLFMDEVQLKLVKDGQLYGHLKDAFPRGVNGYPMFHAVHIISKEEVAKVHQYTQELKAWTEGK